MLDDAKSRLIIPSFEGLYGEPFIYKTPHHPDYQNDRHKKFAHVALHTTAAPSYFPAVVDDGYVMIDGGVWANNPVMNAVVDALACFDVPRENLRVLSLGTGDGTFTVEPTAQNGGVAQWGFLRSRRNPVTHSRRGAPVSHGSLRKPVLNVQSAHATELGRIGGDDRRSQTTGVRSDQEIVWPNRLSCSLQFDPDACVFGVRWHIERKHVERLKQGFDAG